MEQATRHRIAAEQLVGLKRLKRGLPPPGVAAGHTVDDMAADVATKYLSHLWTNVELFFPMYRHYRRLTPKMVMALFDQLALATDPFANLDEMFEQLVDDSQRLAHLDAWHDLLLIERAIAKSRIAPRIDDGAGRIERRLRALRPGRRRMVDRDGMFFVVLKTDLITAFGYPGRDPRRAKPAGRGIRGAIFRRTGVDQPELTWLA